MHAAKNISDQSAKSAIASNETYQKISCYSHGVCCRDPKGELRQPPASY